MKKFIGVLVMIQLLISGCTKIEYLNVERPYPIFEVDGGVHIVRIRPSSEGYRTWGLEGLWIPKERDDYRFYKQIDTLPDGSFRVQAEWLTCTLARDRRTVTVVVEANDSAKIRRADLYFVTPRGFNPPQEGNAVRILQDGREEKVSIYSRRPR